MCHCIVCFEMWPTNINLHVDLDISKCIQCKRDKHQSPQFSPKNDMVPWTPSSGTVQETINYTDATPLECMIIDIACTIILIFFHTSGSTICSIHAINFLRCFWRFFLFGSIPRQACSTPYFVIVKCGCNNEIIEANVRKMHNEKKRYVSYTA